MKASVKICEKCLRNQKFCVHLLLRTDTNIVSQKHNNADNKALPFVHFYYGSRVGSQNLTGQRLFCCHILKLLTDKCEPKLKALRRIIVPLLHPYLNYRTSSISQTERSQNLFAELNPFRIFVMRQNRIARFTKYIKAFFGRISVALLLRVVAVLSQELGVRPLFMQLTDLCSTKCDRTTQAVRRIIVPLLHLYPNYRTSSISRTERSQSVYNHSLWTILKSSPRCFVYLCMSF